MSEPSTTIEEKKDPALEAKPSTSHKDGEKKKKKSSRKRKASTDDPVGLTDDVKAKLKVKLSSSKSSKKKSKKSSKEKKHSKEKSSKRKRSSKKDSAELLPTTSTEASTGPPVDVPQGDILEGCRKLPTEVPQSAIVEERNRIPEAVTENAIVEEHNKIPAEFPENAVVQEHNKIPAEDPENAIVQVYNKLSVEDLQNAIIEVSNELPVQILQEVNVEVEEKPLSEVLKNATVEVQNQLPAEVLTSVAVEVHNDKSMKVLEDTIIQIQNEPPMEILTSVIVEVQNEKTAEVLKDANLKVCNEIPTKVLQIDTVKTCNALNLGTTQFINNDNCQEPLQCIKQKDVELDDKVGVGSKSFISKFEKQMIESEDNRSDEVLMDLENANDNSLRYMNKEVIENQDEVMNTDKLPAKDPQNITVEIINEKATKVLENTTINTSTDLNINVSQSTNNNIYQAQEPFQNIDNTDDVKLDENSDCDSCSVTLVLTDAESESSRNNFERQITGTEYNTSDELLLGFNSKLEAALTVATSDNNAYNESRRYKNVEVMRDQDEIMDIYDDDSAQIDSDSNKTLIEAEDEIKLDSTNKQKLQLTTVNTEAVNVNLNFLKQQDYIDANQNIDEEMDTCEDFHNYMKSDLLNVYTETNKSCELSKEYNSNETVNKNQDEQMNEHGNTEIAEQSVSELYSTEANPEFFDTHKVDKVNEEENKIVDLSKKKKIYKSKATKKGSTKSRSTKSSKSSSTKSLKSRSSKSSKSSSSKFSKSLSENEKLSSSEPEKSSPSNFAISSPIEAIKSNQIESVISNPIESTKSSSSKSLKSTHIQKKDSKDTSTDLKDTSKRKLKSRSRKNSVTATAAKSPESQYKVNDQDIISCRICEQTLNSEIKFFTGEPENGYEEELAIIDSRLLLFNGDEENVSREDTRAYNKLTSYSVYCKNGHLCPFDSGLIERDIEIYFSGYVKPIYSDDPSKENGVPGKDFGPIAEWWTTGFDVGEQPTVAFSTEIGDYILMEPSDEYKPFMHSVFIKIIISKIVIEYLVYEPHATFEDLLSKLQSAAKTYSILPKMTEDVLLQYAPFICMQVMSYDETAKPNEPLMLVAPCIRRLIDLTGISFQTDMKISSRRQYQERRTGDYRKELLQKVAENRGDNSSTSQLIDTLLPGIEKKLIALSKPCTRSPCGTCDRCRRVSCKECEACTQKNNEGCCRRRCFYREIQEENDEDAKDSVDLSQLKSKSSIRVFKDTIDTFSCFNAKLKWLGDPLMTEDTGNTFYASVKHDDETIYVDDFVLVHSVDTNVPAQVVKVAYMWEDSAGLAYFHANLYWWGKDTVLGELARPKELFSIDKCSNISVNCITDKVTVNQRHMPANAEENEEMEVKVNTFYCEKSYDPSSGCFRDLPKLEQAIILPTYRSCLNCENQHRRSERVEPKTFDKLEKKDERTIYRAVMYKDEEYVAGSCVYLKPKSLYFQFPMLIDQHVKSSGNITKRMDEEKYPELYRKAEDKVVDPKFDMPAPFDIGYITEIFTTDKLYIKVRKFYRPENTYKNEIPIKQSNINMLYWSNEVCTVAFSYVIRKCYVTHIKDLDKSVEEWSNLGPDRFYFTQMYQDKKFTNVDRKLYSGENITPECPVDYPKVKAMVSLEIFAGCGGLTLGLRDAGIIKKNGWAIENDIDAANTFQLNNPTMTVLVEHPDVVLKSAMNDEYDINGVVLPHAGDIELLYATLPCENYKDMTDISVFKHSSIATFLSYCDYYKPLLFILEADEKFIKRSVVLKLTLACFVSMGYQVTFDLMQVGCYGASQNRRRSVLLGAISGYMLPKFPQRLHLFPKSLCQLGIVIDSKKYTQNTFWTESAPYRFTTVRDALIDLPNIKVENNEILNYEAKFTSYFSRMMRLNMLEPTVFNHVYKDLGPLVESRITQIPLAAGSDWRNLPNIEVQLKDGSFSKKLIYNYDDVKAGKSSNGAFRGVCSCASGEKCNPSDRQHGCLIPWHLVHSARQHSHWAGIYSRLQWDGFFNGSITNPEPLGTQGPVLHPSQPRVVSVRECARAQGFPDDFVLPQTVGILDMYRIIGRASSPLLGRAIGHEIARSLAARHRN